MMNTKVHASHCCTIHGCKYGNPDCPVVLGLVKQLYGCEDCEQYTTEASRFSYEDMKKAFNFTRYVNDMVTDDRPFEVWIEEEFPQI